MAKKTEDNIVTTGTTQEAPVEVTENADKREKEINAFLDEFAHNDSRRRELAKAIESGEELDGTLYFKARLKKIQNK